MRNFLSTGLLLVAFFMVSACEAETSPDMQAEIPAITEVEVVDLDATTAAALFEKGEFAVLDVRTLEEYTTAHIDGATLLDIRSEGFEEGVAELDQSKPYLVHCAAGVDGGRSRKAVDALKAAGATKIYHLDGGMNAWVEGDHPHNSSGD